MSWLFTQVSLACGGLVCDAGPTPVIQNAERIAFLVDEQAGFVEAHVQVFYEGPPDAFAWVIPIAAEPEVFLSTQALFDTVGLQLAPMVQLTQDTEGDCRFGGGPFRGGIGCGAETALSSAPRTDSDTGFSGEPGVVVVAEGQVGPYDHVVLQASGEEQLVTWLIDNGYAIPPDLSRLLQPYLVPGGHFVAVRLQKDRDTGDIAPLGFRYPATQASIPMQLTAIAAAPDLRLEVSIFGAHRAVPESYLHVEINEANLDWFGGGQNYYDVVSRAADQAGGHAFATDYAGPTGSLQRLWTPDQQRLLIALRTAATPSEWASLVNQMGLQADSSVVAALGEWFEPPLGFFLNVPSSAIPLDDLELATEALVTFVIEPRQRADRLLDQPWVTRLSSSLDAVEMTVDPVFALNPDLEPVDNLRQATLITDCTSIRRWADAPRRLHLSDGRAYRVPPVSELDDPSAFWTMKRSDIEALRITATGRSGPGEVLVDASEQARAEADWSGDIRGSACGCSAAPAGSFALFGVLGLGLIRRRRA